MKKIAKILAFVLVLILCFATFSGCGLGRMNANESEKKPEKGTFDLATTVDDFELSVDSDIVIAEQLNGDEDQFEEFLTTDMTNYGDTVLCKATLVAKEGQTMVVLSYSIKNNAQTDKEFNEKVILNYNNGYEYEASGKYYSFGGVDDWHEYTSLNINPLTTVMCKTYFTVPQEVANNTEAPLNFIISNQEYTIR